jgi:hypothetical protein
MNEFLNSFTFQWIILPLGIVFIRICDVSLGTLRIVLISKGHKYLAPILGFFEVLIWLLAISRIEVVQIIKRYNPLAFYTLEDTRFVSKELSPFRMPVMKGYRLNLLRRRKKMK